MNASAVASNDGKMQYSHLIGFFFEQIILINVEQFFCIFLLLPQNVPLKTVNEFFLLVQMLRTEKCNTIYRKFYSVKFSLRDI